MITKIKLTTGLIISLIFSIIMLSGSAPVFAEKTAEDSQLSANRTVMIDTNLNLKGKIGEAIAKTPAGASIGQIDVKAPEGFAGIPGAPKINYLFAFLWAIWVGWIFSTIGAFGGVMAGVGHLTLLGLGNYANSFQTTNPELNALLTDTIRASNQYMVALAALISLYSFYKMKRLVIPLGVALGIGSIAGGLLIPWLTAGKIRLHEYIGYFGIVVFVIGGVIFYSTTEKSRSKKKKTGESSKVLQNAMNNDSPASQGVQILLLSVRKITFTFYGSEFSFNPFLPIVGGLIIASISSFLGVGGGFLYVPFLTSVVGLPMFIVAGTSALAVFLSMITSIFSDVVIKGTFISWWLIGTEMAGVLVGAMIGPRTQKYIPEIWLKRIFVILAVYVGVRYFSKGFFGQ
ncbi:MAG: sulfite exporter TauE/SafE family protein, partial [SAR324 cluster bacterium]|nr:sulfite exporter TauE/SafE family protein [SAR324 cluster bacterium]